MIFGESCDTEDLSNDGVVFYMILKRQQKVSDKILIAAVYLKKKMVRINDSVTHSRLVSLNQNQIKSNHHY